jgi:Amt family ammonium transporter
VEYVVRRRVDDALDVFGVHGVGGVLGALATGIFASKAVNSAGADGLLLGNPRQLAIQAIAVLAVALYSVIVTWVLLKVLDVTVGLRVAPEEEQQGLDRSLHGEPAYQM